MVGWMDGRKKWMDRRTSKWWITWFVIIIIIDDDDDKPTREPQTTVLGERTEMTGDVDRGSEPIDGWAGDLIIFILT